MDLSIAVRADDSGEPFETAREVVRRAVATAAADLSKADSLTVYVDRSDEAFVAEQMDGVNGWTESATAFRVELNVPADGWCDALRAITAHEYAHTVFYETVDRDDAVGTIWQHLLFEAQSQRFAEAVYPAIDRPWRTYVDADTCETWWPRVRDEWLDRDESEGSDLFFGSETVPQWLGYTLSYDIGGKLRETHAIETFPNLKKADVVAAGDALYV